MKILITGANGQLGKSIKKISANYPDKNFIFTDVEELDITNQEEVMDYFSKISPEFCINAAAYTNVDKAEIDKELNQKINVGGVENLAKACTKFNTVLIHVSSDYVYNNDNNEVMTETSPVFPAGEYALSKLKGEKKVIANLKKYYIIRTSWLYSEYGNNFVKTIMRLCDEKRELKVVNDQIGSPTYASDLAIAIMKIIEKSNTKFGIYNYSNSGFVSWYEFSLKIVKMANLNCKIKPIPTSEYPTLAPRPKNSTMSKKKIIKNFDLKIPDWESSLKKCINLIITNK